MVFNYFNEVNTVFDEINTMIADDRKSLIQSQTSQLQQQVRSGNTTRELDAISTKHLRGNVTRQWNMLMEVI